MSFSLFPKSPKFFDLFREQNRIIAEAATLLNTIAEEFENTDVRCQMINRLESGGDVLNRTISQQLSTTFITPIRPRGHSPTHLGHPAWPWPAR